MNKILSSEILSEILSHNKYGRYFEDTELPYDKTLLYTIDCIQKLISEKHAEYRIKKSKANTIEGLIIFRKSAWDTEHFEKNTALIDYILVNHKEHNQRNNIAKFLIDSFILWCNQEKIEFIVAKVPSLDLISINVLLHKGFNFIESWIFNKIDLRKYKITNDNLLTLRFAKESDLHYMLEYSKDAYNTQRFHADHHIPYAKAEGLYEKWIKNSINDSNQNILVYDHKGIPSAFMTYYILDLSKYYNLKFAMWKMALINPSLRGQGIGKSFFNSLFDHHIKEGLDIVDSGLSLRNIVSLNTHNKVKFKVVSTLVTLHLWM
jgi:GNAT superfamily N-acetyltransferase